MRPFCRVAPGPAACARVRLHDHADSAWADTVADRREEVEAALLEFFDDNDRQEHVPGPAAAGRRRSRGHHLSRSAAAVRRCSCAGEPGPLAVGPSSTSWRNTTRRSCSAARSWALCRRSRRVCAVDTRRSFARRRRHPSNTRRIIVEVGCGSGAVARWLARYVNGANPITGVDVNAYLLREARRSRDRRTLEAIPSSVGDAEALPLASASFDVTLSSPSWRKSTPSACWPNSCG